ncbi:DEAD/DEAH box helicase family protein, partial [Actinopolymorpha sp. B17G11]|uniref:DEAD/DEAH box helicase family protein n=1 Tax=Actinopolymorpha sp. B17G11 TaxID=3160861 RepID=UPI0032E46C6E
MPPQFPPTLEHKVRRKPWNSALHPRDRLGRFIETGGLARVWGGGVARVLGVSGNGYVRVEGYDRPVHRSRLAMVERPGGGRPTRSKDKVLAEDERRETGGTARRRKPARERDDRLGGAPDGDQKPAGVRRLAQGAPTKEPQAGPKRFSSLQAVMAHWRNGADDDDDQTRDNAEEITSASQSDGGAFVIGKYNGKWRVFTAARGRALRSTYATKRHAFLAAAEFEKIEVDGERFDWESPGLLDRRKKAGDKLRIATNRAHHNAIATLTREREEKRVAAGKSPARGETAQPPTPETPTPGQPEGSPEDRVNAAIQGIIQQVDAAHAARVPEVQASDIGQELGNLKRRMERGVISDEDRDAAIADVAQKLRTQADEIDRTVTDNFAPVPDEEVPAYQDASRRLKAVADQLLPQAPGRGEGRDEGRAQPDIDSIVDELQNIPANEPRETQGVLGKLRVAQGGGRGRDMTDAERRGMIRQAAQDARQSAEQLEESAEFYADHKPERAEQYRNAAARMRRIADTLAPDGTPRPEAEPTPEAPADPREGFSDVERALIRNGVDDMAGQYFGGPMNFGKSDAVRYVSEILENRHPELRERDREKRHHVWDAVEAEINERPDVLNLPEDERKRRAQERRDRANEIATEAGQAYQADDYDRAEQLVNDAERLDPAARDGLIPSYAQMREGIQKRRDQAAAASRENEAQRQPQTPEGAPGAELPRDRGELLEDVPAEPVREGGRPGDVLQRPGESGEGRDQGGAGGREAGGRPAGEPDVSGREGGARAGEEVGGGDRAARPGVPAAGAGDGEQAAGRPGPARVGGRGRAGTATRKRRGSAAEQHPVAAGRAHRFKPEGQADLAPKGERAKLDANMAALRLLRKLEAEDRQATAAEQRVLARWAGWGSLADVFNEDKGRFAAERAELKQLLTPQQYEDANHNVLNAHYTDAKIVGEVWRAMQGLGFRGGDVLEPGSGSGNFMGLAPENTHMTGVELDPITAAISRHLYPDADVYNESFGSSPFREGVFDAVVGNVPFGRYPVNDKTYNPGLKLNIHDHFILKALANTKPGGIATVVTSSWTLDKADPDARQRIAKYGDLLGAVRLPGKTHAEAAGTDVVTDVLVFRRRKEGDAPADTTWLRASPALHPDGRPVLGVRPKDPNQEPRRYDINDYFRDNPDKVLGTIEDGGYNAMAVNANGDVQTQLRAALKDITDKANAAGRGWNPDTDPDAPPLVKRNVGGGREGRIAYLGEDAEGTGPNKKGRGHRFEIVEHGRVVALDVPKTQQEELRDLLQIRDAADELIEAETTHNDDHPGLADARKRLNKLYDAYVAKYKGPISRYEETDTTDKTTGKKTVTRRTPPVMRFVMDDEGAASLFGLEHGFDPGTGKAHKADIFHKRQIDRNRDVKERADTPEDALALAAERGEDIDAATLARLLDVKPEQVEDLVVGQRLAYIDPEGDGSYVPADLYLSGNIRNKLAVAREAAEKDPKWQRNVEALESAMPADATLDDVPKQLGAPWMGTDVIRAFAKSLMRTDVQVEWDKEDGWKVTTPSRGRSRAAEEEWGTPDRSFYKLLEAILKQQHKIITIRRRNDDGTSYVDPKAGELATAAAANIEAAWNDYLWSNSKVGDLITKRYNQRFRSIVPRVASTRTRAYPGMNAEKTLRPHQNAGVNRIVSDEAVLLEHVVGSGKTFTLAAGAMELRRLGLANKIAFNVPNPLISQWMSEFRELYPNARVLAVDSDSLKGPGARKRFAAKVRNNDWDAVIFTGEAFEAIPVSEQAFRDYMQVELDALDARIRKAKAKTGKKVNTKHLEAAKAALKAKIAEAVKKRYDEGGITFEELGIDYVMVDEAHRFKNLPFATTIQGVQAPNEADRARDMHMKLNLLRDRATGRGGPKRVVSFATGTPISNSLAEMYTMMRMLRPDLLEEANIEDFDSWAATFARIEKKVESDNSSNGYVERVRFRGFTDAIGDGLRIWRTFADTVSAKHLEDAGYLKVPKLHGGARKVHVVERSEAQDAAKASFKARIEAIAARGGKPGKGDDIPIAVIGDGRAMAIDPRLMSERGLREAGIDPDDPTLDSPKLDEAAGEIAAVWRREKDRRFKVKHNDPDGTPLAEKPGALQMVFIDSSAPKEGKFNAYDALKERLVAQGMDPKRIRFVQEAAGKPALKARMMEQARQGDIDVLIGSTEALGTGTNAQNRLAAMHHIEASWRPSDIEQREGRGLRQGNQYGEVESHVYITKGTHDEKTWDMIAYKQAGLDAMQNGDYNQGAIEFADDADPLKDFDTLAGEAAEDPLAVDMRELQANLKNLEAAKRNYDRQQSRARSIIDEGKRNEARYAEAIRQLNDAISERVDTSGEKFAMSVRTDRYRQYGTDVTSRDAAAEAMKTRFEQIFGDESYIPDGESNQGIVGELGGFYVRAHSWRVRGREPELRLSLSPLSRGEYGGRQLPVESVRVTRDDVKKNMKGVVTRLEMRIRGLEDRRNSFTASRENTLREIGVAESQRGREFRQADELQSAQQRMSLVSAILADDATDSEGAVLAPEVRQRMRERYGQMKEEAAERFSTGQRRRPSFGEVVPPSEQAPSRPAAAPEAGATPPLTPERVRADLEQLDPDAPSAAAPSTLEEETAPSVEKVVREGQTELQATLADEDLSPGAREAVADALDALNTGQASGDDTRRATSVAGAAAAVRKGAREEQDRADDWAEAAEAADAAGDAEGAEEDRQRAAEAQGSVEKLGDVAERIDDLAARADEAADTAALESRDDDETPVEEAPATSGELAGQQQIGGVEPELSMVLDEEQARPERPREVEGQTGLDEQIAETEADYSHLRDVPVADLSGRDIEFALEQARRDGDQERQDAIRAEDTRRRTGLGGGARARRREQAEREERAEAATAAPTETPPWTPRAFRGSNMSMLGASRARGAAVDDGREPGYTYDGIRVHVTDPDQAIDTLGRYRDSLNARAEATDDTFTRDTERARANAVQSLIDDIQTERNRQTAEAAQPEPASEPEPDYTHLRNVPVDEVASDDLLPAGLQAREDGDTERYDALRARFEREHGEARAREREERREEREGLPPKPTAPNGTLNVLSDVANRMARLDDAETRGVGQLGLNPIALRNAIEQGYLRHENTGNPNEEGGPNRLWLTDAGREQVDLDDAYRRATATPRRSLVPRPWAREEQLPEQRPTPEVPSEPLPPPANTPGAADADAEIRQPPEVREERIEDAERATPPAAAPDTAGDADIPDAVEELVAETPTERETTPEQLEGEKFPPSPQQQAIFDAVLAGRGTTKAEAKAGAGKTTTLEMLARRIGRDNPDERIAYVAFNKSVQTEAESRMPANTEPRTGHSIAFQWASKEVQDRTRATKSLRRADDVARHLGISRDLPSDDEMTLGRTEQAMAVTRAVATWANSADDAIGREHLPDRIQSMPAETQDALVALANKAWADLKARDGRLKLTLDHVRKMWALSRPDFTKSGSGLKRPATTLFLDEAQDTPPVLAKVIEDQNMRKVIVGDADQAIYGFTGAVDYLSTVDADADRELNVSYRFGPQVAEIANRFLQMHDSRGRVVGAGADSTVVESGTMQGADAILVRSNGGAIAEILREQQTGRTVGVPKGTKRDLTALVDSARYLKGDGPAPERMHEDLEVFRTWAEVVAEASKGDDPKLKMLERIVRDHGVDELDEIVQRVIELGDEGMAGVTFTDMPHGLVAGGKTFGAKDFLKDAGFRWREVPGGGVYKTGKNKGKPVMAWTALGTPDEREATLARAREMASGPEVDVVVSTAHKAKGLEWDRVRIGDDFQAPTRDNETGQVTSTPSPEELRLAYVAVTRARKELDPGSLDYVYDHTDPNGDPNRRERVTVEPEQVQQDLEAVTPDVTPEEAPEAPRTPTPDVTPDEAPEPETAPEAPEAPTEPTPDIEPTPEVPTPVEAPEAPDVTPEAPTPDVTPEAAPARPGRVEARDGVMVHDIPAGQSVETASGRTTTPFPPTDFSTTRRRENSIRRSDAWLWENARAEADSRGIPHGLPRDSGEMSPADREIADAILFDRALLDMPARPSILRPLRPEPETPTPEPEAVPDVTPETPAAPETPAPSAIIGRVDPADLRVGDVIDGKRPDGSRGPLTVESAETVGNHVQVTGRDENGNRNWVRLPVSGHPSAGLAKLIREADDRENAEKAWNREVEPDQPGDRTGPMLPENLREGDLIEANITIGRRKMKGNVRLVRPVQRRNALFHEAEVEWGPESDRQRQWINLSSNRPVNVLERAPEPDRDRLERDRQERERKRQEEVDRIAQRERERQEREQREREQREPGEREEREEREIQEEIERHEREERERRERENRIDGRGQREFEEQRERDQVERHREERERRERERREQEERARRRERRRRDDEDEDEDERRRRRRGRYRRRRGGRGGRGGGGFPGGFPGLPRPRMPELPDGSEPGGGGDGRGRSPRGRHPRGRQPRQLARRYRNGELDATPQPSEAHQALMRNVADNPTLDQSPGGGVAFWSPDGTGQSFQFAHAPSGLPIGDPAETASTWGGPAAAAQLAQRFEDNIRDPEGNRFPWNEPFDPDAVQGWRDGNGDDLPGAMRREKAAHDAERPTTPLRGSEALPEDTQPVEVDRIAGSGEPLLADGTPVVVPAAVRGLPGNTPAVTRGAVAGETFPNQVVQWPDGSFDALPPALVQRTGVPPRTLDARGDAFDAADAAGQELAPMPAGLLRPGDRIETGPGEADVPRRSSVTGVEPGSDGDGPDAEPGVWVSTDDPEQGPRREFYPDTVPALVDVGRGREIDAAEPGAAAEGVPGQAGRPQAGTEAEGVGVPTAGGEEAAEAPALVGVPGGVPGGAVPGADGTLAPDEPHRILPTAEGYTPRQLDPLADSGALVAAQVGPDWHLGTFKPDSRTGDDSPEGPSYTLETPDGDVQVPARDLDDVNIVGGHADIPGDPVDPATLPAGTRVRGVGKNGRPVTGSLVSPDTIRDGQSVDHALPPGSQVEPVYRHHAGQTPAPETPDTGGAWTRKPDGTLGAGSDGEWEATVTPGGSGAVGHAEPAKWHVVGHGDREGQQASGEAPSTDQAKQEAERAVEAMRPNQPDATVPHDPEQPTPATGRENQPKESPEPVAGHDAQWVPVHDLKPGDIARVTGIDTRGREKTLAGWVVGGPNPVTVSRGRRGTRRMFALTIGQDRDGSDGTRDQVYVPIDGVAARADRPDAEDPSKGGALSLAETDVMQGNLPEKLPVDSAGKGLYPGSVVSRGGKQGIVTWVSRKAATVNWGDGGERDEERPGLLTIDGDSQARPPGWTVGGERVRAGQMVQTPSGAVRGIVETVDGDDVTIQTPQGLRKLPAGNLTVVGKVNPNTPDTAPATPAELTEKTAAELDVGDVIVPDGMVPSKVLSVERDGDRVTIEVEHPATGETHVLDADRGETIRLAVGEDGNPAEITAADVPDVADPAAVRNLNPMPIDAVSEPTALLRAPQTLRERINDLGLDTDVYSLVEVSQAAARVRARLPLTARQAELLAETLDGYADDPDLPEAERRRLRRGAQALRRTGALAAGTAPPAEVPQEAKPERTSPADLVEGDMVAVANPDGTVAVGPLLAIHPSMRGRTWKLRIGGEDRDIVHTTDAAGDVWRLPDLPEPDTAADPDLPAINPDEIARNKWRATVRPQVADRIGEAVDAVMENVAEAVAQSEDDASLVDRAEEALTGADVRNALEETAEGFGDRIDAAGGGDRRDGILDATQEAAESIAQQLHDNGMATVGDVEPIDGESDADRAARVGRNLQKVGQTVDVDEAAEDVLDRVEAGDGADETAELAPEQRQLAIEGVAEAADSDIDRMVEQLEAIAEEEGLEQARPAPSPRRPVRVGVGYSGYRSRRGRRRPPSVLELLLERSMREATRPSRREVRRAARAAAGGQEPSPGLIRRVLRWLADRRRALMAKLAPALRALKNGYHAFKRLLRRIANAMKPALRDAAGFMDGDGRPLLRRRGVDTSPTPDVAEPRDFPARVEHWQA